MDSSFDAYNDVVATYIRVIQRDSPEAAGTVEQILAVYGSRAALRATLVLTLLKIEARKNHAVGNIDVQVHLIKEFPEALPLLNRAIAYCLQAWDIPPVEPFMPAADAPMGGDEDAAGSLPLLPPT